MWNSLVAIAWSQRSVLKKEKLDSYFWEKHHHSPNNNNESKYKNNPVLWRHLTEPRLGNASPKHQEMDVTAPYIEQWQDVRAFLLCVVFPLALRLKCSLTPTGSRGGAVAASSARPPPLFPLPGPSSPPFWETKRVNRKPTFYVLCKIDIFNIVPLPW